MLQALAFVFNFLQFSPQYSQPSFIPYAAQVTFELRRFSSGSYLVNASYNGQPLALPGACNGSLFCPLDVFAMMARAFSFYGNPQAYEQLCGQSELERYTERMA